MPTKLPRISITLPAETIATLSKLATLQKRPRSAIAADLLTEMTPSLDRISKLLEAAMRNRASLPANTAARLAGLEEMLGGIASHGMTTLESIVQPLPAANGQPAKGGGRGRRKH